MTSKDSDAGYELPQGFCKQSVYRIFGYTATEELEQFLQKCPRHYLRSYFAEVYLGSADRVNEIRSNNDKYLLNKLVQAIQAVGIPVVISAGRRGKGKSQRGEKVSAAGAEDKTTGGRQAGPFAMAARAGPNEVQSFPKMQMPPPPNPLLGGAAHVGGPQDAYLAAALSTMSHQQLSALLLHTLSQQKAASTQLPPISQAVLGRLAQPGLQAIPQGAIAAAGLGAFNGGAIAESTFNPVALTPASHRAAQLAAFEQQQQVVRRVEAKRVIPQASKAGRQERETPGSLTASESPTAGCAPSRASAGRSGSDELGRSSFTPKTGGSDGGDDASQMDADDPDWGGSRSRSRQRRSPSSRAVTDPEILESSRVQPSGKASSSAFQALLDVAEEACQEH